MNDILMNPSSYSLAVNSGEFPNGAINGSLSFDRTYGGTFSGTSVVGGTGASNGGGMYTIDIVPNPNGSGSLLNYTIFPTGIGNSITSLGLYSGTAGTNGTLVQSLSGSSTLTHGRLSGSVAISNELAQQLARDPGSYYLSASTSSFPNGAIRAQFGSAQHELWFPAFGSASGINGSLWESDLQIYNLSSTAPANVMAQMLSSSNSNVSNGSLSPLAAATLTINADATSNHASASQSLLNQSSGMGGLRLMSDQPLLAMLRIYDANGEGNQAAAMPLYGLDRETDAFTHGAIPLTPQNDNATRSNVGVLNPNNTAVSVTFTYHNGHGQGSTTNNATRTVTLQPYQQMQLPLSGGNGLFTTSQTSNTATSGGAITFAATAPLFVYTSSTNNTSGDTHIQLAKQHTAAATISDAEIAAILNVANEAEIQQGNLAMSQASNADVRAFAQRMVTEHTNAQTMAQSVFTQLGITPAENATTQFLRTQNTQLLASLGAKNGADFDQAYIQSQVQIHSALLATIDQVLMPSATSDQMRNLLSTIRASVASHLDEARNLAD
ncbi:MAG: DUF4142 domain-containing protein [Thermoanaerobaculia bacterium]